MQLRHAPVVEHLAATHGVAEVDLPVVLFVDVAHRSSDAAFGHDGVGLAEEGLAHECDLEATLLGFNGSPEASATGADDDDVVTVVFGCSHGFRFLFGST